MYMDMDADRHGHGVDYMDMDKDIDIDTSMDIDMDKDMNKDMNTDSDMDVDNYWNGRLGLFSLKFVITCALSSSSEINKGLYEFCWFTGRVLNKKFKLQQKWWCC